MPADLLKSLEGSWEGICRTWFEPGKLAGETRYTRTKAADNARRRTATPS